MLRLLVPALVLAEYSNANSEARLLLTLPAATDRGAGQTRWAALAIAVAVSISSIIIHSGSRYNIHVPAVHVACSTSSAPFVRNVRTLGILDL